jgi:peptidoglycan/LPS O-acetylase OafA/YrhL
VIHNRALDGLRGVAVLFVILFHFGYFTAGWIGVQVFFVLSGYLITSILLSSKSRHHAFFFRRFYWRRSLRIFPLYFAYLAALGVLYALRGVPAEFGERWLYLFSYTYNYALLLPELRQSVAFTHFWSLAVEEQFYLVWPLAVYYLSSSSLRRIVVAALVLSPMCRMAGVWLAQWLAPEHPEPGLFAYSPLPAQLDALAAGAALALVNLDRLTRLLPALAVLTCCAFAAGLYNALGGGAAATITALSPGWFPSAWDRASGLGIPPFGIRHYQHVWSYSLVNVWSALLIVAILRGGALAARLSHPVLLQLGKVSYGAYVLHYPMLGILRHLVYYQPISIEGFALFGGYLATVFGAAALSFRFLEAPFMAWKDSMFSEHRGREHAPAGAP